MRLRGRTDGNHVLIIRALRQAGASVQSLANVGDGCPDLMVALGGSVYVMEVKDGSLPPSKRRLTPMEKAWIDNWRAPVIVVESVTDALHALGL